MPVDGLVKRLNNNRIYVPSFQRKFVWTFIQASRFIESLLLGLPVPGVFLFKEQGSKLMVIDGQQRLLSLQKFYDGKFDNRIFKLSGVKDEFSKKTYETLNVEDQERLDDAIIHATIFQQDHPSGDRSSIYSVFERLNTGGNQLHPQEIRACVYRGKLNDLLAQLARNSDWRKIYGTRNSRKKDEEIILRFLALFHHGSGYQRPMKGFLNKFMQEHQNPPDELCKNFRDSFENTIKSVAEILGGRALRPTRNLNVSVADAVLVGLAHRVRKGPITDPESLRKANKRVLEKLKSEELYSIGTTNKDRVNRRIELARCEFESVS